MKAKKKKRRMIESTQDPDTDPSATRLGHNDGEVSLDIQAGEVLTFVGHARLKVESGAIEISGYTMRPGAAELELTADAQICGPLEIRHTADSQTVLVPLAAPDIASLLLRNQKQGKSRDPEGPANSYQIFRGNNAQAPAIKPLPEAWHLEACSIVNSVREAAPGSAARIVVAGTRNIGKSTFSGLLVNALLSDHQHVAFLDTDLGQPELTVPGVMSLSVLNHPLLGPPHMHHRRPERQVFLGEVSPQGDPVKCQDAVKLLFSWYCDNACQEDAATGQKTWPPLVVNTHGWIQGLGLEVLNAVMRAVQPSHAVLLRSESARRNLPGGVFWAEDSSAPPQPVRLSSIPGIATQLGAADTDAASASAEGQGKQTGGGKVVAAVDMRNLAWLAFANRCCQLTSPGSDGFALSCAAQQLARQTPWVLSFQDVQIQVLHSAGLSADCVATILNCSIVGLANTENQPGNEQDDPKCEGVGFVRGVDAEKGLIYLLTDLDAAILETISILQVGKLALPPALLQTASLASPYISHWTINTGGSGTIKSRNNIARLSQR